MSYGRKTQFERDMINNEFKQISEYFNCTCSGLAFRKLDFLPSTQARLSIAFDSYFATALPTVTYIQARKFRSTDSTIEKAVILMKMYTFLSICESQAFRPTLSSFGAWLINQPGLTATIEVESSKDVG